MAVNAPWPSFVVNPLVFKATSPNQLKLSVCANYIQEGHGKSSNMAVMEVSLPSGFTLDKDSLPALRRFKGVKRVDPAEGDTKVLESEVLHNQKSLHPFLFLGCLVL